MSRFSPGLFDDQASWQEEPVGMFAEIVFDRPIRTTFTYAVPKRLCDQILAGKRVKAPFGKGNRGTVGFCVGVTESTPLSNVKPIESVLDERPLLSLTMMDLTHWIADRYHAGWGQVLAAVLPAAVKNQSGTKSVVILHPSPNAPPPSELPEKQRRAFEALLELARPATIQELANTSRTSPHVVRALIKRGALVPRRARISTATDGEGDPVTLEAPLPLSDDQKSALVRILKAIETGGSTIFLLHGVTGSGKTEVYLQSIQDVVRRGRQAIVLVPEISLTPQTIERFRRRFTRVAVLHSRLSDVERFRQWKQIEQGEVQVVVGARSALFAPFRQLGLIVIDEEHEHTFKQEITPRYHARDVAAERARREGIPLILGSATPSMESWLAAQRGDFELLRLPRRVANLTVPKVRCIDLRQEYKRMRGFASLSPSLVEAMKECLRAKGQTILLLNRRGFAPAIYCPQCGSAEKCRDCDIALTFHKSRGRAVCHSCDATIPVPRSCTTCSHPELRFVGAGTQRLEDEVRARFPDATMARMDSDTMRSDDHYKRTLGAFRDGQIDILLGTQMIAKGLDFPNVRLVGVISADTARSLPDFRSAEKTFQLLLQVAGRAGRGSEPGLVLIQTFNPDDDAIRSAARGDFEGFVGRELALRREHHYPPYALLTRIIVRSKEEKLTSAAADQIAQRLHQHRASAGSIQILGPAPAPVTRLKEHYRYHLQIHTPDQPTRQRLLDEALDGLVFPKGVEYAVDVDPVNML